MSREELLKDYILKHYKSIRDFCMRNDFPYTTVDSIFKRGFMKSSVSLAISICDRLGIDIDSLVDGKIKEKTPVIDSLSVKEFALIEAYRNNPSMQEAVDRLLGLPRDDSGVDCSVTVAAAPKIKKST